MGSIKSVFAVLGAAVPVVYCGGLAYFFLSSAGSWDETMSIGLGPTVVGLGAVGLFFCIPLLVKFVGAFNSRPSRPSASTSTQEAGEDFDADAVVARYMASKKSAQSAAPRT